WLEAAATEPTVWAATYTPDNGWGEAEQLGEAGVEAFAPEVAINDSGSAIVVWRTEEPASNLRSRYYDIASESWEATELPTPEGAFFADNPRIALTANETAVAVWVEYDAANDGHLWSNRFTPDDGWATAVPIQLALEVGIPDLAMNQSGHALVVWSQF